MPRTSSRISASAWRACSWPSRMSCFARGRIRVDPLAGEAEVDRQHDEALLGAVVEVALDPVQLARLDVEDRRAALAERLDLAPQLAALARCRAGPTRPPRWSAIDELRQRRGDRQQRERPARSGVVTASASWPANGRRNSGSVAVRGVVPDRRRQQRQREHPAGADDEHSMNASGRLTPDVEDVAPAALVGELGSQGAQHADPARAAGTGCGDRARRLARRTTRQRSMRATSREPSIATPSTTTPTPANRSVKPVDAIAARMPNAKMPTKSPSAIAAFAYQVAGWMAREEERPDRTDSRGPAERASPVERMSPRRGSGPRPARPGPAAAP